MACEQLFAEQVRRHGMRMTAQRARVLAVLHGVDGMPQRTIHALPSVTSLLMPRRRYPTVYRTLSVMCFWPATTIWATARLTS